MMIAKLDEVFGRDARSRLAEARQPGPEGALAALETFYYAFNHRDLDALAAVWLDDDLVQLSNPLGGVLSGAPAVRDLYERIFTGPARVWVEFGDIVVFTAADAVIFAGRERGEFTAGSATVPLAIRTSRVFIYQPGTGWRLVHHHGSIDDPGLLRDYQDAVAAAAPAGRGARRPRLTGRPARRPAVPAPAEGAAGQVRKLPGVTAPARAVTTKVLPSSAGGPADTGHCAWY